jgi:hypothetical protein
MADEDKVGATVVTDEIRKALPHEQGMMLFPHFDANHIEDYIKVQSSGVCLRERTINFLVDFAVIGTDLGSAKELLGLAGSIVQVNPGTLNPTTVITVAGKVIDTLADLEGKRNGKGSYKFSFPVHLCCHKQAQPFVVSMDLEGILQVQSESPNDFVELYVTLIAIGPPDHRHIRNDGSQLGRSRTKGFSEIDELKPENPLHCSFVTDADFDVIVIITEECHVNYDLLSPSIAGVRINHIKIQITTIAECKDGRIPPFETPLKMDEHKTTTPSEGTNPPKTDEGEKPKPGEGDEPY